jgi:hypothetical protein
VAQIIRPVCGESRGRRWAVVPWLLILSALACNFPTLNSSTSPTPHLALTVAAQTVQVQFTLAAIALTDLPNLSPTVQPTSSPGTPEPSVTTPTPLLCDRAAFVADVTFPDNAKVAPGAEFTKTWRLRNAGTCSWNTGYSLVFDHGEAMSAPPSVLLSEITLPGKEIEISVALKAPDTPGVYQGYWQLRNAAGQLFGLGANADKYFWVKIQVVSPN